MVWQQNVNNFLFTLRSGTVDAISFPLSPSLYSLSMTQDSYRMCNSNDGGQG